MKFSSLQENLKNGLFIAGHIAGKNINLPILNNILIKANKSEINIITTDLEIGITCSIRGKVEKEGSFTVDAKIFSDFISLLPNKKVDIELKESKIKVTSDNYKTIINGQGADDYPLIPKIDKKTYFRADVEEFKKALSQVVFAVSNNETRVELSGVLFDFNDDKLIMAATDSYRLAEKKIEISTNSKEAQKIIIPAKTLQEVMRILSGVKMNDYQDKKTEIEFYLSESQLLFSIGNVELITRLIEGQYPDYTQIIPQKTSTKAVINREELIRAVKASAIFSKTGVNDINIDFPSGKNKIIISSASSQAGENIVDLDANVSGDDNGMVVNFRYLLDGLNSISSENVVFEVVDGNTPCILRPEKQSDYIYIIMPIKQ